jgi:short-subunit dehydrogenase
MAARPQPRHVAITGASRGLGAAFARLAAAPGRRLSLAGRTPAPLRPVAAAAEAAGAAVDVAALDVSCPAQVAAWLARIDGEQPVDLLLANAGLSPATSRQDDPAAAAGLVAAVNFAGLVASVAPLVGPMTRRGHGRLVLVGSLAGRLALPGAPAYAASKAGVARYAEALAGQLRGTGVSLTLAEPGFVATAMTEGAGHRLPGLMTAEEAAARIWQAALDGRRRVAFPAGLALATRLAAMLPAPARRWLLRRVDPPDGTL